MAAILFTGGVRCGKTDLAQKWATAQAPHRLYLATCKPADDEMLARIRHHKEKRDASWACLEEPLRPLESLEKYLAATPAFTGAIVVDCLSMWVANLMQLELSQQEIMRTAESTLVGLARIGLPCALVSAECGLGFVPSNSLCRHFGDILGLVNQLAGRICSDALFVVCGLPLVLKGKLPASLEYPCHFQQK